MIVYVDGSAVVNRILEEPDSELVIDLWEQADEVVSSDFLYAQSRAALAALRGEGRIDSAEHHRAVSQLEGLVGGIRAISIDGASASAAGGLADRHGLDALDALHLAAALSVDAPRVVVTTWQPRLSEAAADCGLPVVPRVPTAAAA